MSKGVWYKYTGIRPTFGRVEAIYKSGQHWVGNAATISWHLVDSFRLK